VVTALGWLWFVNLYNFMDGIDGITGIETASLGVGIALVAALSGVPSALAPLGLACAAAGLGFLVWNWHPARIFLGDSGSVPLGLLLGGLLVQLAVAGQLAAALILPAYYLADATITLGKRAARGEKVWQAHRQHFYQRAVQGGKRHDQVVKAIAAGNLLLVGCAVLATMGQVVLGLAVAVVVVAGLLALLQAWSRGGGKRA
jgi:UDP-N-acetylmuramyl pentapeptide phosphotransferase/UDP-N-acetylglucosamine-1-phosphate transferase